MNAWVKRVAIIIAALIFLSLTISSCDHHSCPTYSQAQEAHLEKKV